MPSPELQHKNDLQYTTPVEINPHPSRDYRLLAEAALTLVNQREQIIQSEIDPVTLLPNRVVFDRDLKSVVTRAAMEGKNVGLAIGDLDGLKRINDTKELGHTIGDAFLRGSAHAMQGHLRPFDKIYRIGGDEYAILLEDFHPEDDEQTDHLRERLEASVAEEAIAAGVPTELRPGISIGIAVLRPGETPSTFQKRAFDIEEQVKRERKAAQAAEGVEFTDDRL